jgi:hypothetical protein
MDGAILPQRIVDPDGHRVDAFALPTDEAFLERLLRELFAEHWAEIAFGPVVEGGAWEFRAEAPPDYVGLRDGYLTIAFGVSHFHLCIGETRGSRAEPTPPALARRRRCARAELFRRLDREGAPHSWGLRLFNGAGEQLLTVFFPNPFFAAEDERVLRTPDWSRLALWDAMRARHLGLAEPDPFDRIATRFLHG